MARVKRAVNAQKKRRTTLEAAPKQDGRNMTMVIAPNKKPAKPRAAAQPAAT